MGRFQSEHPIFAVAVDLVVLTLRDAQPCVLLVRRGVAPFEGQWALPGGFVQAAEDLQDAALRELAEETGFGPELVTGLEQLRSYGAPGRDPRPERVVSVAWVVLGADLPDPVGGTDAAEARWVPVAELAGLQLAFDHDVILADGMERARSKLEYTSLATAFVGDEFTIAELRGVYESIWGVELDPANFQRKVTGMAGFLEPVPGKFATGRGRPAQLFQAGPGRELYPPLRRA